MEWNAKDSKTFIDFHKQYSKPAAREVYSTKDLKKMARFSLIRALKDFRFKHESGIVGAEDALSEVFRLLDEYESVVNQNQRT